VARLSRVAYVPCHDLAAVVDSLAAIAPKTAIIDIEPMIAAWNSDKAALDAGLAAFLDAAANADPSDPAHTAIVFATNAWRSPTHPPTRPGRRIGYVAHAGKPLRTARFRDLARPGVVVGDQIATDGLLAWRLGYGFAHYNPPGVDLPFGPRLMRALGRPLGHVLFRSG
jgi:hypothetical protein